MALSLWPEQRILQQAVRTSLGCHVPETWATSGGSIGPTVPRGSPRSSLHDENGAKPASHDDIHAEKSEGLGHANSAWNFHVGWDAWGFHVRVDKAAGLGLEGS